MTSKRFEDLSSFERTEALDAMSPEDLLEFACDFEPHYNALNDGRAARMYQAIMRELARRYEGVIRARQTD